LEKRLRALFAPAVARLGWSVKAGESELVSQLRGDLIGALGTVADDEPTQARAQRIIRRLPKGRRCRRPQLIPALVAIVAHTGGSDDYEMFSS
jgi:hypothetical protein